MIRSVIQRHLITGLVHENLVKTGDLCSTQLATMCIGPKFVRFTADVVIDRIILQNPRSKKEELIVGKK